MFVCLLFCILYLKILSNVFVLGIKSHKLFPALFLEGCTDSKGNRLEICRGAWSGRQVGQLHFQTASGGVTVPRFRSVRCAPGVHSHPSASLRCVVSIGMEHLLLSQAAADVRPLSPPPGFSRRCLLLALIDWARWSLGSLPAFPNLGLKSFSLGVSMQPREF